MIENQYNTRGNNYSLDKHSYDVLSLDEKPYFYINGHEFNVSTKAESKSEINIVKNKMYVPGKNWGYTDMQWTNFSGESLSLEIYSRINDKYTGKHVQPDNGGISDFYTQNETGLTPHAVLKYWAQMFVTCHVETNLHAFESGDYKIDEFSQTQPDTYFVITKLTLLQYEDNREKEQTYNQTAQLNTKDTSRLNAQSSQISGFSNHTQDCVCTSKTDASECIASPNEEVGVIQLYLQQWGYFPSYSYGIGNIEVNGKYCYHTTQAIKKFQEDRGIETTGNFDEVTKSHFVKKLEGL